MVASTNKKVGLSMKDFTWKLFSHTGNIDTYLLFKELEKDNQDIPENQDEELAELDFPIS
ncbi:YqzL-like protein [Cytobacillus horneckiae]